MCDDRVVCGQALDERATIGGVLRRDEVVGLVAVGAAVGDRCRRRPLLANDLAAPHLTAHFASSSFRSSVLCCCCCCLHSLAWSNTLAHICICARSMSLSLSLYLAFCFICICLFKRLRYNIIQLQQKLQQLQKQQQQQQHE